MLLVFIAGVRRGRGRGRGGGGGEGWGRGGRGDGCTLSQKKTAFVFKCEMC